MNLRKIKLWWFSPREIISTIKMRLLRFCDKKGCWNICICKHAKHCNEHVSNEYFGEHDLIYSSCSTGREVQ